jgi:hypothetical protein
VDRPTTIRFIRFYPLPHFNQKSLATDETDTGVRGCMDRLTTIRFIRFYPLPHSKEFGNGWATDKADTGI